MGDYHVIFDIIVALMLIVITTLVMRFNKKTDINEIIAVLKRHGDELRDNVAKQIADGTTEQFDRFGVIQNSIHQTLATSRAEQGTKMREFQEQIDKRLLEILRSGVESNEKINANVTSTLQGSRTEMNEQFAKFSTQLDVRLSSFQEQTQKTLQASREEINKQLREFGDQVDTRLSSIQRSNTENMERLNATLESKIRSLQESNEKRLEQMQAVVDEKLQKTLETRLSQSFELVGKQLDNVQQGLGEMKNLAADARSLKNALTNVKERGTYGEVRLERLLADMLAPNQYEKNVEIGNNKRVEFAVKMPGNSDTPVLLPIDSKFPIDDYNRLLEAEDKAAMEEARRALAQRIRQFAKDICDKYIVPPVTTDFALMFLPTEGLYAEVVQNATLFEELRTKYKVMAVGATTLSALLGSLLVGFKTVAFERRTQEVWNTLRKVKSEFLKFGDLLEKARKQIQTADNTLEEIVGRRTRAINRTLRTVEELDETDVELLIASAREDDDDYDAVQDSGGAG